MKKNFVILLLLIIFFGCEKSFEYNVKEENSIVVSCFLRADDTVKVHLSYSNRKGNNFENIENAEVFIYEENILKEKLLYQTKGMYQTINFIPQAEKKYSLKVKVADYDTVYAHTFIPKKVKLDTLTHFYFQSISPYGEIFEREQVYLQFKDNPNERNYYLFRDKYNIHNPYSQDKILKDLIKKHPSDWFEAAYFDDALINGETYNLSFIYDYISYPPDSINLFFEFGSISEEMYLFLKSYNEQSYNNNFELGYFIEPIPVFNNVVNGIGIFAGYSTINYEYSIAKPNKK